MNKAPTPLSLDDLDAAAACAKPYEFEYVKEDGTPSGIWFSVFGGESATVQDAVARLQNERRRKQAAREIAARIGTGAKSPEFESFEADVEYGKRIAAARVAGWRAPGDAAGLTAEQVSRFCGISTAFSPENALRLCMSNAHIAAQITAASEATENFIKL